MTYCRWYYAVRFKTQEFCSLVHHRSDEHICCQSLVLGHRKFVNCFRTLSNLACMSGLESPGLWIQNLIININYKWAMITWHWSRPASRGHRLCSWVGITPVLHLLNIRCIQTSRDIILVLAPNSLLVYFASASNPLYSIKQLPKKFCCKPINAGYS